MSRTLPLRRLTTLLVLAVLFALAAFPQKTEPDLSWLAGVWTGPQWGGSNTEMWSAPDENGEMFGAYRFVKDGKPQFYELLAIERHDGEPMLVMRHFHRGLIAWEEKDAALRFKVEPKGPREVLFRQVVPAGKFAVLRYWQESADTLEIELIHKPKGKEERERFSLRRATPLI